MYVVSDPGNGDSIRAKDHPTSPHCEVLSCRGPCPYYRADSIVNFLQSLGSCVEMTAGVVQIGLQWLCFSFVCVPSEKSLDSSAL